MSKYKDELLKRMANSPKKNLAAFLSMKGDIAEALDEKIPMSAIHADLVKIGKIDVGYVQFCAYVKKHIGVRQTKKLGNENTEDLQLGFKHDPVPKKYEF